MWWCWDGRETVLTPHKFKETHTSSTSTVDGTKQGIEARKTKQELKRLGLLKLHKVLYNHHVEL